LPVATPLVDAVWRGDIERVRNLIQAGEDPAREDDQQRAPWEWALIAHDDQAFTLLFDKVSHPPQDGRHLRALSFAAAQDNVIATRALLARDIAADTSQPTNSDGITPLMVAASSGYTDVMRILLDAGAAVNRQDLHGDTALMAAVRIGSPDAIKLLVTQRADANLKDEVGRSALTWAARSGRTDIVRLLIDAGANIEAEDAAGRTAFMTALETGHKGVADELHARGARGDTRTLGRPVLGARGAVEKSLPLLQRGAATWRERRRCPACHHTPLIVRVAALAKSYGFAVDTQMAEADHQRMFPPNFHEQMRRALESKATSFRQGLTNGGDGSFGNAWFESALVEIGDAGTEDRQTVALVLARMQASDGSWRSGAPRVPIESSDFTATATAARVLAAYGPPGEAQELRERLERAKQWLITHVPVTTDDKVYRLLGLRWTEAAETEIKQAADVLTREQGADGGWSQLHGMNSDAYATGMALVALHQAVGLPVGDPLFKRGVDYLLRTQEPDGSWLVHKRAAPLNGYFESGFPHGKFQFISFAGSCWATMALIYSAAS
jgi:ankyrin repeat protein